MNPRTILLLGGCAVAVVSAVNPACSPGPISIIASEVAGFPEAQSYCSKNYPLPVATVTGTAAPVTTTVATTTRSVTVTGPATTVTSTNTATATATTTTTVTVSPPYATKKKREPTTDAPMANLLCKKAVSTSPSPAMCTAGTSVIQGRKCNVQCNIDRPGGDYAQQHTGSFAACIQACAADARCVTAQYHEDNGYCYLKSTRNSPVSASGDDTVDCDPVSTTTTTTTRPPSTTTTTTTTTKPLSTTTTTTLNPWQSVLSAKSSIIGQICTCVETPQTTTVSTTPTVSVTATSTISSTVTPTSTNTVTTTTTTTVTITATSTAVSTATCGPTVPARNQAECGSDPYCCDSSCNTQCNSPAYICYQACSPDQCANSTPGNAQTISYYGDGTCYATTQCSCPASRARRALEAGMRAQARSAPGADDNLVWRIHV